MSSDSIYSGSEDDTQHQPGDLHEPVAKRPRLALPQVNDKTHDLVVADTVTTYSTAQTKSLCTISHPIETMVTARPSTIPGLFLQADEVIANQADECVVIQKEDDTTDDTLAKPLTPTLPQVLMNRSGVIDNDQILPAFRTDQVANESVDDISVVAVMLDQDLQPNDQLSEEYKHFLLQAEENKEDVNAEWQLDSSPEKSDASDDSSGSLSESESESDDNDDDESNEDQVLKDIQEEARRMMQEDTMSDDEDRPLGKKGGMASEVLRTRNEMPEEQAAIRRPDLSVTADMVIVMLGVVESIVGLMALIRASTSGEYQVLNEASLLVFEDRSVLGVVQDTLGRVEEPLYTVRFSSLDEVQTLNVEIGKKVFYVPTHSTFVFTKALKAMKGSDASNIYDEEVNEEEQEFSDDEAEADYKRRKKGERKSKANTGSYSTPSIFDEPYTPLVRPTNLHELMSGSALPPPPPPPPPPIMKSQGVQQRGGIRRGRGRNHDQHQNLHHHGDDKRNNARGSRGRGRGSFESRDTRGGPRFSPRHSIDDSNLRGSGEQIPRLSTLREQWELPRVNVQHQRQSQTIQYPQTYSQFQLSQPAQWSINTVEAQHTPTWPGYSYGNNQISSSLRQYGPQTNLQQPHYQAGYHEPSSPYFGNLQSIFSSNTTPTPTVPFLPQGAHINPAFFARQMPPPAVAHGDHTTLSNSDTHNNSNTADAAQHATTSLNGPAPITQPSVQDILRALQMNM